MKPLNIPLWKTAPFVRLILPLIIGITTEWYAQIELAVIIASITSFSIAFFLFSFLPLAKQYRWQFLPGISVQLLVLAAGMLVTWNKDVRHHTSWYGNHYKEGDYIVATITEPLVEKSKSYKADGYIEQLIRNDSVIPGEGKLLLYLSKDSTTAPLQYGDQIIISKKPAAIKNSGNPGAFNYERYAAFQQIFHNVYLKPGDWIKTGVNNANGFRSFLFTARKKILSVLQQNITGGNPGNNRDELGIAEALLIGYTNDLDKDLVQAYSNTGVVHIIAISGMHLGLIYGMLLFLFAKLPLVKRSKLLQAVLILGCLWLFSLLTGASASVVRSAVMFTFITIGRMFFKQASVYNSLAASAFVLLCYNPYYLWDVGFQLSYLAVVGIVVFQKPIYNCWYIQNKYMDMVWKAAALTTAAQILTFPVCIYYFHQFPVLFLVTNLIAVPLSTVVLYAAILLVCVSWVPAVGMYAGKITGWLLWLMNKIILWMNELPFAVWDKIPAGIITTWLLYATVVCSTACVINKSKRMLYGGLLSFAGFLMAHAVISWQVKSQQKFIVYNIPQHQAIDFIDGNTYRFAGDSVLLQDGLLQNFHLKPGRTEMQLHKKLDNLPSCFNKNGFYEFGNKKILVLDENISFDARQPIALDYIVVSKNPRLDISQLARTFRCGIFIFDASNSLWKIEKWKQACDKLHLQYHSIPEQGAFVADL